LAVWDASGNRRGMLKKAEVSSFTAWPTRVISADVHDPGDAPQLLCYTDAPRRVPADLIEQEGELPWRCVGTIRRGVC